MRDIVGERLRRETAARRKDQLHYALLYSFLAVNAIFITYKLFF